MSRGARRAAGATLVALLAAAGAGFAASATEQSPARLSGGVQLHALVEGRPHDALFAIDFDHARGLAVGAAGQVVTSDDGGRSWRSERIDTRGLSLLGVDTQRGVELAVGQQGVIYRRSANGPWLQVQSGTEQRLFSVAQGPEGLALAVGAFGALLRSVDGGQSWVPVTIDWQTLLDEMVEPHLYDVTVAPDGAVFAVGEFGLVLRSADGGQTWTAVRRDEATLFAIELRSDGVGYAVGQSGTVLRSADGGLTWTALAVDTGELLLGVATDTRGETVIAGMREVLRSRDDGNTWKRVSDGELGPAWYAGVATPGERSRARAVGQAGRLVRVGR